jgi:hypothetical protein
MDLYSMSVREQLAKKIREHIYIVVINRLRIFVSAAPGFHPPQKKI